MTPAVLGLLHHLDLTVRDPWASAAFYDAVLGFMGYRRCRADERGIDWCHGAPDRLPSIGLVRATGPNAGRAHDRYSPGLHHVAFRAASRDAVDALHRLLISIGAHVLDPPADYPAYGSGYYAVMFADPDGLKLEFVYEPL